MIVFTVASAKGGVAKSSTAIYLAAALSRKKRVVFADLDPQGDATQFFFPEATPEQLDEKNVMHVLRGEATVTESIWPGEFCDVLPSVLDLTGYVMESARDRAMDSRLRNALRKTEDYGFAVIDTPGTRGGETFAGLLAADVVLIPVIPEPWAVRGAAFVYRDVQKAAEVSGTAPVILFVPSQFGKSQADAATLENLRELKGAPILSPIPRAAAIRNGIAGGRTLKDGSAAHAAFENLAAEVLKHGKARK